jgi:hypothetical protein
MGWPIPNIAQTLDRIGQRKPKFYAVLDLTQGYYQTGISVSSRDYTAFRTSFGLYRWKRLPMGLKGAPSYFQQQMQSKILGDLLHTICEIYLDDIIIFGRTEAEFSLWERLEKFNVTLNPAKAKIGVTSVEYVGHVIDGDGLNMSQKNVIRYKTFVDLRPKKDMKSFLGLVQQFRTHLRGYETYGHILTGMTKGYNKRNDKKLITWTDEEMAAFIRLQNDVVNCPPLFFPDQTSPIFLHTDASNFGDWCVPVLIGEG